MCVDDDEENLLMIKHSLAGIHAEVISTADIEQGLNTVMTRPVAVAICSLAPSGGSSKGNDIISRIKEISPDTTRVLTACTVETNIIIEAINQGEVWKCLTQPLDSTEIRTIVSEGIELWQQRRMSRERPIIERPDFHLQIIRDITDLFNQSEDLEYILPQTIQILGKALNYDVISIYLWEERKKKLVLRANQGFTLSKKDLVQLKADEGLIGFVYTSRKPLITYPASKHPSFKPFPEIGEDEFENFIGVPILFKNKTLGVLAAQMKENKSIATAEATLFQIINSRLAGLLDLAGKVARIKDPGPKRHASRVFQGKGVSAGFASGQVYVLKGLFREASYEHLPFEGEKNEIKRANEAFQEVEKAQKELIAEFGKHDAISVEELKIFKAHHMILRDQATLAMIFRQIEENKVSAEQAVIQGFESVASQFEDQKDRYLQERALDFRDIGERLLQVLLEQRGEGVESKISLEGLIVVSHDIGPALLPSFSSGKVAAIVTERGGATSHTAILAKSLGIPAVSGIEGICAQIHQNERMLVDGRSGFVFVNPDDSLLREYEKNSKKQIRLRASIEKSVKTQDPARSPAKINANIGLPADLDIAGKYNVKDVGLYRTELAFMQYERWPTILEQFWVYENVARKFPGYITIRTLDIGADKLLPYFKFPPEDNPLLGLRSIRFSMEYLDYFRDQLRAILLAVRKGCNFRILLPMVSHLWEVETAREVMSQISQDLDIAPEKCPKLGIMMEVPAVMYQLEDFKKYIDFVAVGTNDLVQYTLAVDRNSSIVGHLYSELHPAIIRVLASIFEKCGRLGLEVSVCGEMAGNPAGALALAALGCFNLSVLPSRIPVIRYLFEKLDLKELPAIKSRILMEKRQQNIEQYLNDILQIIDPKLLEID